MESFAPLLPLVGLTIALVGLLGVFVFVFLRLRNATKSNEKQRLSEEAFAASTIQAALAASRAPGAGAAGRPAAAGSAGAAEDLDAAALDALPAAVVATDEAGVVRRLNAAARTTLGLTLASMGHPYRSVLAAWPGLVEGFARAHGGTAAPEPVVVRLADGSTVTAAFAKATTAGRSRGAVAILTPASAAGAAAAASPGPIVDADVAPQVARLAGGLAHELANSLTTVHGYASLIDRTTLSDADRSAFEQIVASAESMLRTVDAFRALVRPLKATPAAFPPADAVQGAIDLACQEIGAPAEAVRVDTAPCGLVMGDQVLLEEAIAAVIVNAVEASRQLTPPPPVAVRVAPAAGGGVAITIADRGAGVAEELRARLGQPFHSDKAGHAGLGLARAFQVIAAHPPASMTMDHPLAGGLTVTIALPTAR